MFNVNILKSVAYKELALDYNFNHFYELQKLIDSFHCDFNTFIQYGFTSNSKWFYAWDGHPASSYLGVLQLFDRNYQNEQKDLLYIRCKNELQMNNLVNKDYSTIFFPLFDKDIVYNKIQKIKELKAFL